MPVVATDSRHSTSRGQARHTEIRASSSPTVVVETASRRTCASERATGVEASAGSPGHPVPGGTGERNGAPVTGWGRASSGIPACCHG